MAGIGTATITITPRLDLAGLAADLRALADHLDGGGEAELKFTSALGDAVAGRILLAYEGK